MSEQSSGNDVHLLLVSANVLRLRREFDLAAVKCGEVLAREANNAAAHSLMGDIACDQGNLKDAIEWYKLALDLAPDSASDRKKLEAVIDQVYSPDHPGALDRLKHNVAGQIEGARAEIRAAAIPLSVYLALGAMIGVIILVTVTALILGRRSGSPVVTNSPSIASGGFSTHPSAPTLSNGDPPEPPVRQERFPEGIMSIEVALFDHLKQQARIIDPKCDLGELEVDPMTGVASLRFTLPNVWSTEDTRKSILRVAEPLAVAAINWDERIGGVRLRGDTTTAGQPNERAFVGVATAASLAPPPSGDTSPEPFAVSWWRPDLRPIPTRPEVDRAQ